MDTCRSYPFLLKNILKSGKLKASHKKVAVVVAQEYDLVLKALAERFPAHFVELVRGIPVQEVRRAEKEAVATKRESDILFQVKEDGYEYLMAVEMQIRPDHEMPRRLLEYTAMHTGSTAGRSTR